MSTTNLLKPLQKKLKEISTPEARSAFLKFVPGAEKAKVYGVRMPLVNQLAQAYKKEGLELAAGLWQSGWFEEKILALKIMERMAKKDPDNAIALFKKMAAGIDNWAVCDAMGMQSLKQLVTTHQAEIFALAAVLNRSEDFWQRRLSLVMVEWYTRLPDCHPAINKLIKPLEDDNEYYVKKAIVWLRRNMNKGK
jgi:3-methyladenine DNA glycosylase AlkD